MNHEPIAHTERREFLGSAARTAAIVAGATLLGPSLVRAAAPLQYKDIYRPKILNLPGGLKAGDDIQVLNYALTLEDLESDLYIQAVQRLTMGGTNKLGKQIPGLGVNDMEPDVKYLKIFAEVEAEHRDFLRGSLNSLFHGIAVSPYKYDFGIETKSREEVLDLVLTAEALGTAAYLGAVPYLKTRLFITAAAAIQGTEARHTATLTLVQNQLFGGSKPSSPLASDNHGIDMPMDPDAVLAKVSPYIVR
ncbi:hypothetical protein CCAX7_17320 [Capsulimonas corticalis]|uniref:Uncharacterized protein n=1 Tax=Capsulimonas corticalis TaxID=2219043 RepID=A0A402D3V2_9BACT|nr:ferritin-like domain-containing protein [Capsulimonas corticalis]BDI29681.1 hypothetical protein CCAX7_17320 [Capsulimonas corticalis]